MSAVGSQRAVWRSVLLLVPVVVSVLTPTAAHADLALRVALRSGGQPAAVAVNEVSATAYVATYASWVDVLDTDAESWSGGFWVPGPTSALAVDQSDGRVFVGSGYPGRGVYAVDPETGAIVASNTDLSNNPFGMAIDEATGNLIVLTNGIAILDRDTLEVIAETSGPSFRSGVAVDSLRRRVYTLSSSDYSLVILDADSLSIVGTRALAHTTTSYRPNPIAVNEETGRVYVAALDHLETYDSETDALIGDLLVNARTVSVDVALDRAYVASDDGFVSAISGDGSSVLSRVAAGQEPWGIATDSVQHKSVVVLHSWTGVAILGDGPSYNLDGFVSPVENDVLNVAKAGSTIPLKFRVTDQAGLPVLGLTAPSGASFASVGGVCDGSLPTDNVEQYSSGSGLQELGDGYYQFNWKTPKEYKGQCRTVTVTVQYAPSVVSAAFRFR